MRPYWQPPQKRVRRPAEKPYAPEPYSQGPHALAAHAAGGKLIGQPLPSREKWAAMLAAHAPGCGSPISVEGTNGGSAAACGATVDGRQVFCPYCDPGAKLESARAIVALILDKA